jgi:hypothetical protein
VLSVLSVTLMLVDARLDTLTWCAYLAGAHPVLLGGGFNPPFAERHPAARSHSELLKTKTQSRSLVDAARAVAKTGHL